MESTARIEELNQQIEQMASDNQSMQERISSLEQSLSETLLENDRLKNEKAELSAENTKLADTLEGDRKKAEEAITLKAMYYDWYIKEKAEREKISTYLESLKGNINSFLS